jgi:hypothetical protein
MELFFTKVLFLRFENPGKEVLFFQQLTQYSEGNIVLHLPVSNIDGFLRKGRVLLPFTCKELLCTKLMFHTHKKSER